MCLVVKGCIHLISPLATVLRWVNHDVSLWLQLTILAAKHVHFNTIFFHLRGYFALSLAPSTVDSILQLVF